MAKKKESVSVTAESSEAFISGSIWAQCKDLQGNPMEITIQKVADALKAIYGDKKFYIKLHDKDIFSEEDTKAEERNKIGTPKPSHIHYIVEVKEGNFVQHIAFMSKKLGCETDAVSIRQGGNLKGAIRYLFHRDNEEKYQYDAKVLDKGKFSATELTNFITNNVKALECLKWWHWSQDNLDKCDSPRDCLKRFGESVCNSHRAAIGFQFNQLALTLQIKYLKEKIEEMSMAVQVVDQCFNILVDDTSSQTLKERAYKRAKEVLTNGVLKREIFMQEVTLEGSKYESDID